MKGDCVNQWLRLQLEIPADYREILAEVLWALDTVGFRESEEGETTLVEAFFLPDTPVQDLLSQVVSQLTAAGAEPLVSSASLYEFEPDSWLLPYRSSFREFSIGDSFFIYPPWKKASAQHAVNIVIEPSLAFGTGTHESTRLALLTLERVLPLVGSMLDVGTGSGILSIAAKKLKSDLVVTAFDNDMLAVQSALKNLRDNKVEGVRLFAGEPMCLRGRHDLTVANLTLELFKLLAADLVRLSRNHMVLSGFTTEQADFVLEIFQESASVGVVKVLNENDWVCLHLRNETSSG